MMYAYTYDANNRLTTANFTKTGVNANGLDEGFAYDVNGNITKISRYDYNGVLTDSIKCTYSGNSIQSMYDKQGDVASVVDFPGSITPKSVNYDQNGNETSEPHRYIATTYNLLNLPKQIIWGGSVNRKISYFYTFNGEKLRKTVEDNGTITKVDYCGPFVYETVNGTRSLKYIITPHGRAVKSGSSFEYEYNITDHLGNVRAVIKKYTGGLPMVVQARHYYSFGMEMSQLNNGTTVNKYQYNGKEIQDDFGLYWYDYGARFYDPALGRFHSVDPLATDYYFQSPYAYAVNNPLRFTDFMGMGPEDEVKKIEPLKFDLKEIFTNALASVGLNPKAPTETTPEKLEETAAHNEKQAEIRENITETVKSEAKDYADAMETTGTVIQGAGYVAAPFTAGESMILVGAGKVVAAPGTVINYVLDASEGNYGKAAVDFATNTAFGTLGNKVKSLESAGKFTKESSGILQFFTDAYNKTLNTITSAFSNRNNDKKNK